MSKTDLQQILDEIALLIADSRKFRESGWVEEMTSQIYLAGSTRFDWLGLYGQLVRLFYRISFLGIAKSKNVEACYAYEDSSLADNLDASDTDFYFEIHPAFRKALNITSKFIQEPEYEKILTA